MEFPGFAKLLCEESFEGSVSRVDQVVSRLVPSLTGACWIFLSGDLGAGKTTFVQRLAERIGVVGAVVSPTFSVVNTCNIGKVATGRLFDRMVHLDLYRIKSAKELLYLGIETEITPRSIVCVEWPEMVESEEWSEFFATTRCPIPSRVISMEIVHGDLDQESRRYSWRVLDPT